MPDPMLTLLLASACRFFSGLSISRVFVDVHVVNTCAGRNRQVKLCCVSMTGLNTLCGVVSLHTAATQMVLKGQKDPLSCRLAQAHTWVAYSVELQQQPA